MPSADPQRIMAQVYALLGRPSLLKLPLDDVKAARIAAGMEILRAIASNPQNPHHGSLATLVTVAHNAFLPSHDGEPGIPVITPFDGASVIDGVPADPDEIDSYRSDPVSSLYTGAVDGVRVAHNAADANGQPSPLAGRYSIVNGRLKFTGFSAQVPLIQTTRTMADTGIPENYEPTVVKLTIAKVGSRQGADSEWSILAAACDRSGQQDEAAIRGGSMNVSPVPGVEVAQRAGVV